VPLRTGEIFSVRHERKEKPKRKRAHWDFTDLNLELVTVN
jgi:hypothetical protein